jgi:putative spermidine/putrescine transport system permease protein
MPSNTAEKILIRGVVIAILIFLIGPLVIVCGLSLNKANLIKFPPQELSLRWFADVWKLDGFVAAVVLSLKLAALTTMGTSVLGVMASLALVRYRFFGRNILLAAFLSPLVLPAIVIGIALLQYFRAIDLLSTFSTLLIAHIAVTLPFMVRTMTASLEVMDENLFDAAKMMGADALQTFIYVTMPSVRSGFIAGALFTFILSFDNYTVSLFLTDPQTETLPIRMLKFTQVRVDPTVAAAATILIGLSLLILVLSIHLVGLRRLGGLSSSKA